MSDFKISRTSGAGPELDSVAAAADPEHAFLRAAWFAAAADTASLTTVVVHRSQTGEPVLALPLVARKIGILPLKEVPGSYWPFRSFPIAADVSDAEVAAFLSAPATRRTLGPVWRLGPVLGNDPTLERLVKAARQSGWRLLQRHAGTSYEVDIAEERKSGSWPRPSTVKNIQKQEKKLAKLGSIGWRHVAGSGWTAAALDDLCRIERNSWVGSRSDGDPKFLHSERRRGWEAALADPVIAGHMTVGILLIDEEPVSFSFGINAGGTRYSIATSYDERFAKHSAGYVTGYRTYFDAADGGVDVLNLGTGDGGAKASMGATPGPEMVDCLFVRNPLAAALLGPVWKRSGVRR
jgi:CelD/BcsL family acetyltransferase involved in cellulose biosynthesis